MIASWAPWMDVAGLAVVSGTGLLVWLLRGTSVSWHDREGRSR